MQSDAVIVKHGMVELPKTNWQGYGEIIRDHFYDYLGIIYRGQNCSKPLLPSLDRKLNRQKDSIYDYKNAYNQQLEFFKKYSKGRLGAYPLKENDSDDLWWALGQHYGLATPLMDWTESPFIALFFAFEEPNKPAQCHENSTGAAEDERTVLILLDKNEVQAQALWEKEFRDYAKGKKSENHSGNVAPPFTIIEPPSHNNPNLISQRALFIKGGGGKDLESWIAERFPVDAPPILYKVKIQASPQERLDCLRYLDSMNINRMSLFPDLRGACKHCNLMVEMIGIMPPDIHIIS